MSLETFGLHSGYLQPISRSCVGKATRSALQIHKVVAADFQGNSRKIAGIVLKVLSTCGRFHPFRIQTPNSGAANAKPSRIKALGRLLGSLQCRIRGGFLVLAVTDSYLTGSHLSVWEEQPLQHSFTS